jgi:hypothetical protein
MNDSTVDNVWLQHTKLGAARTQTLTVTGNTGRPAGELSEFEAYAS